MILRSLHAVDFVESRIDWFAATYSLVAVSQFTLEPNLREFGGSGDSNINFCVCDLFFLNALVRCDRMGVAF